MEPRNCLSILVAVGLDSKTDACSVEREAEPHASYPMPRSCLILRPLGCEFSAVEKEIILLRIFHLFIVYSPVRPMSAERCLSAIG